MQLARDIFNLLRPIRPHKSFSQTGEDLIVDYILRGILRKTSVRYLDVGANDPVRLSNTYYFYKQGFSGVCVEPNPELCRRFQWKRPRDKCLNVGVALSNEREAEFYVMDPHTLSSFSKPFVDAAIVNSQYRLVRSCRIPLLSLDELIEREFTTCPDYVSIDVEGHDYDVLRSLDLARHRPSVICIESVTHTDEQKIEAIEHWMTKANYFLYADTFINSIYVEGSAWAGRR